MKIRARYVLFTYGFKNIVNQDFVNSVFPRELGQFLVYCALKPLYLAKRVRPDILTAAASLITSLAPASVDRLGWERERVG